MKMNVVFVHEYDPRQVLEVNGDDYYVVQSKRNSDMGTADQISGDLTSHNVKWLLNVTRGTLVDVEVLGRHCTVRDAIRAAGSKNINTETL